MSSGSSKASTQAAETSQAIEFMMNRFRIASMNLLRQGNVQGALNELNMELALRKKTSYPGTTTLDLAALHNLIGTLYCKMGNVTSAIDIHRTALDMLTLEHTLKNAVDLARPCTHLIENSASFLEKARSHCYMGACLYQQEDFGSALLQHAEELTILKAVAPVSVATVICYGKIGMVLCKLGDTTRANVNFMASLQIQKVLKNCELVNDVLQVAAAQATQEEAPKSLGGASTNSASAAKTTRLSHGKPTFIVPKPKTDATNGESPLLTSTDESDHALHDEGSKARELKRIGQVNEGPTAHGIDEACQKLLSASQVGPCSDDEDPPCVVINDAKEREETTVDISTPTFRPVQQAPETLVADSLPCTKVALSTFKQPASKQVRATSDVALAVSHSAPSKQESPGQAEGRTTSKESCRLADETTMPSKVTSIHAPTCLTYQQHATASAHSIGQSSVSPLLLTSEKWKAQNDAISRPAKRQREMALEGGVNGTCSNVGTSRKRQKLPVIDLDELLRGIPVRPQSRAGHGSIRR